MSKKITFLMNFWQHLTKRDSNYVQHNAHMMHLELYQKFFFEPQ